MKGAVGWLFAVVEAVLGGFAKRLPGWEFSPIGGVTFSFICVAPKMNAGATGFAEVDVDGIPLGVLADADEVLPNLICVNNELDAGKVGRVPFGAEPAEAFTVESSGLGDNPYAREVDGFTTVKLADLNPRVKSDGFSDLLCVPNLLKTGVEAEKLKIGDGEVTEEDTDETVDAMLALKEKFGAADAAELDTAGTPNLNGAAFTLDIITGGDEEVG